MRQNGSCFIGKRGTFQNASKLRQKCIKHARNTFGEKHLLDDTDSFHLFKWGRLLENSFLEHFCLNQHSVIQGKFYMQRKVTFGSGDPPVGWGSFTRRGGGRKFLPLPCLESSSSLGFWVSKRGIWDVPGILPGCPGPLGVFKKLVQKKVRAHFSFPIKVNGIPLVSKWPPTDFFLFEIDCQNSPDRGQSRKIRFSKFPGSGLRKI